MHYSSRGTLGNDAWTVCGFDASTPPSWKLLISSKVAAKQALQAKAIAGNRTPRIVSRSNAGVWELRSSTSKFVPARGGWVILLDFSEFLAALASRASVGGPC